MTKRQKNSESGENGETFCHHFCYNDKNGKKMYGKNGKNVKKFMEKMLKTFLPFSPFLDFCHGKNFKNGEWR